MGLQDILRDTNSARYEQDICGEEAIACEMEKLAGKSDQELWDMHVQFGLLSAQGRAVLALLKQRCPESFKKN